MQSSTAAEEKDQQERDNFSLDTRHGNDILRQMNRECKDLVEVPRKTGNDSLVLLGKWPLE